MPTVDARTNDARPDDARVSGFRASYPASFGGSASALLRLSWARTVSPILGAAMLLLVLLPLLFAMLFVARAKPDVDPTDFLLRNFDRLVCTVVTPLLALLLGTSAFSAESEDGTLLYVVTTTTPRWWISAVRVAFATVLTAALSATAVSLAGITAMQRGDDLGLTFAFAVAVAIGGATYGALFTALSLLMRRALVAGLGYVVFWEGILSLTFPGVRYLSVHQWMLSIANALTEMSDVKLETGPSITSALVGVALVLVISIYVGGRKLNQPRIARTL